MHTVILSHFPRLIAFLRANVAILIVGVMLAALPVAMQTPQRASAAAMTGFTQVQAFYDSTCALKSDATVWCWGSNSAGQLGNGTVVSSAKPVQVSGLTDVSQIEAGGFSACALKSNATVWCWGYNLFGQLGNGTSTNSSIPVQVSGITVADGASQISLGQYHACALKVSRSVICWGWGDYQQNGNSTNATTYSPMTITGISTATQVATGISTSCALLSNQTVSCWGSGYNGQFGNNVRTVMTGTPQAVTITDVSKLTDSASFQFCATKSNQSVWCWGKNPEGVMQLLPVELTSMNGAISFSEKVNHACAVKADGTPWCWGKNSSYQLGDGTNVLKWTPQVVNGVGIATQISVGSNHSCALLQDTTIKCWGRNYEGQIGDGTVTSVTPYARTTAVSVIAPPTPLSTPTSVVATATPSTLKSISVSWAVNANASTYTLNLYNSTGATILGSQTGVTGTSTTITSSTYASITNNTSYKVTVTAIGDGSSYLDSSESSQVSVTTNTPAASPVISSQPTSVNRTLGQTASFSVTATRGDSGTLSYDWNKDGVSISGEVSSTLTLSSITSADAAAYTVVVTNTLSSGVSSSTTSAAATLTVSGALSIATPTTGLSGTAGSGFSLAVPGTGGRASLTYSLTGELVDGLSLSASTRTISGTPTVAGSSTVSVTVTDANGATATTSDFTISVGYASTTVSLELAAGSLQYRTTKRITATTSRAGSVNFMLGGISIDGCGAVAAASTTAVCDWVPVDLGAAALSAVFTPTASTAYSNSTASLSAIVAGRAITVTPTSGQSKVFGASDPAIQYSVTSGSLYGQDTFTGSLSRVPGEDAGRYSISGGTLSNANYDITLTSVNFTISRASQAAVSLTTTSGVYGTGLTLVASGGSGTGSYSFAVTTVGTAGCSITSGVLNATSAGACTVTATRALSTNYLVAHSVATTVTISRATQTPLAVSITNGDLVTGIIVATTGGSGSGVVTSSVTTGTANCSLTSGVATAKTAGTCSLTVTKASDASYVSESVTATLTFTKVVSTTGRIGSVTSGTVGSDITLSFTGASGTGSVTYVVSSSGTARCTVVDNKLSATSAGTCTVTVTKQGDDTYADQVTTTEFTFTGAQTAAVSPGSQGQTNVPVVTTTTVAPSVAQGPIVTTTTIPVVAKSVTKPVVTTTTTTTTVAPKPQPVAPSLLNTPSTGGAATIGGKVAKATTTRVNNQLVFTAGGFTVTLAGVRPDGSIIPLTSDGLLEVQRGDIFRLDATGFAPGSNVDIWMFSKPVLLANIEVGANGLVRSTLKVPKSVSDGLHHLVMVGVVKANTEAKFEVGMNVGVPPKQWWLSRWLLIIPVTLAVFAGFWLPTTVSRRRKRQMI